MTVQNDQVSYVKHILDSLHVFFTLFGCLEGVGGGGGVEAGSKGLWHDLLMQFPTLYGLKMEISNPDFFLMF